MWLVPLGGAAIIVLLLGLAGMALRRPARLAGRRHRAATDR